jgi:hypothetical protein
MPNKELSQKRGLLIGHQVCLLYNFLSALLTNKLERLCLAIFPAEPNICE